MIGSGCSTCPVENCDATIYRGSRCAALRAEENVYTDPKTNADRIRSMTDMELAKAFIFFLQSDSCFVGTRLEGRPHYVGLDGRMCAGADVAIASALNWLKMPAEEE